MGVERVALSSCLPAPRLSVVALLFAADGLSHLSDRVLAL